MTKVEDARAIKCRARNERREEGERENERYRRFKRARKANGRVSHAKATTTTTLDRLRYFAADLIVYCHVLL